MPTVYGSRGTDWGVLTALQGRDNWAQKRADRNTDMKYAMDAQAMAQRQLEEELASGAKLEEANRNLVKLKVLAPDMTKLKDKSKDLQQPIVDMLKKYNNDVSLALKSGGYDELMKYSDNLFSSPEMTDALQRATWAKQLQDDKAEGKILRPIEEEINGSKQKYDPEQRYNDFLSGKAKDFKYDGGYKPFEHDYREAFGKNYGSGDKYKPKTATKQDVFVMALREAKRNGLSERDGVDYGTKVADEYENGVKAGTLTPYLYKFDDSLDRQEKQARIASINRSNQPDSPNNGGKNDGVFWVQNVNAGGDKRGHALGYLPGASNGNGTVINAEDYVTKFNIDPNVANNPRNYDVAKSKIVVTFRDKNDRILDKTYDLRDANDVAELQSLKESQKGRGSYLDEWNAFTTTSRTPQGTTTTQEEVTIDTNTARGKYNY